MKVKTSELIGNTLNWAVATAKGIPREELRIPSYEGGSLFRYLRDEEGNLDGSYMTGPDLLFSTKWEAGGPIIEREQISVTSQTNGHSWAAKGAHNYSYGPTPLIAAMRCYVAAKLGDEVDVPEELLK